MHKWICLLTIFLTCLIPFDYAFAEVKEKAIVLEIKGPIGPATQDYIERGIEYAKKTNAAFIILEMDTPGGLETSMRGINADIFASPIPVITYVTPTGARAASAGTYIMYASHFAFMAPNTQIGAATPVEFGVAEKDKKHMSASEIKAINDATAYLKSLAELRGRNANWAELAVKDGKSLTATEAKQQKVIDNIAVDYPDLFKKIDGRTTYVAGTAKQIDSKHIQIEKMAPDWHSQFLSFITNPNIAYILMLIAVYGLFFELSNPGLILPGVVGLIALFLMLYAFQLMPINYAGLALIVVGIGFMLLEVYVTSFGMLGIGGVIAFVLGSVMLFDWHDPNFRVAWLLVATMSIVSLIFFIMLLSLAYRSHKKAIVSGHEAIIGSTGTVISVMNEQVIVRIFGEIWEARATLPLEKGQQVKVINVEGLTLFVEPVKHH